MTSIPVEQDSGFPAYFEATRNEPTYVILGSQGSGTNLLSRMLRAVFGFSVVLDRSLVYNAAANVLRQPTEKTIQREMQRVCHSLFPGPLRKRLIQKHYFHQAANYEGLEQHLGSVTIRSADEFARFFYAFHGFVASARHVAIKSDDIWEQIELLPQLIPRHRIILLVRDPRDNALSIMNKPFGPCEIYAASEYVQKRLRVYRDVAEADPQGAIVIKYEELLNCPMDVARELTRFLGVEAAPDLEHQVEGLNIRRANHDKWKKLPVADLNACEAVLGDDCRHFGYQTGVDTPPGVGPLERARRRSHDFALRIPQKLKRRLRDWTRPQH